jgi:hypothetical protein
MTSRAVIASGQRSEYINNSAIPPSRSNRELSRAIRRHHGACSPSRRKTLTVHRTTVGSATHRCSVDVGMPSVGGPRARNPGTRGVGPGVFARLTVESQPSAGRQACCEQRDGTTAIWIPGAVMTRTERRGSPPTAASQWWRVRLQV